MNGPKAMYAVKPIFDTNYQIELPKVMYTMKKIHENQEQLLNRNETMENNNESRIFQQVPLNEITELENQQDVILRQLLELKEELSQMRLSLNCNSSNISNFSNKPINKEITDNIVINADPKYPPYALVALLHKWGSKLNLSLSIFTHSSVSLPENLKNFFPSNINGHKNNIEFKVIWKNVGPNMELIISPLKIVTISGEANIVRFLSRMGPSEHNYEILNDVNRIDEVLDHCLILMNSKLVKDRQAIFKKLSSFLGKGPFFFSSNNPSIADTVLCSTCIHLYCSISKNMTSTLIKWFTNTKQYFDIKGVLDRKENDCDL